MDDLAELYAIIKTTDHLEGAYVADACTPDEYTTQCKKLIAQFKQQEKSLIASKHIEDVVSFMRDYRVDCAKGINRLVHVGVPATFEHDVSGEDEAAAEHVALCTQHFITAMDAVKLESFAVDELHPLLADVMQSLSRMRALPADMQGKAKVREWVEALNQMRAADQITEEQARQLTFDLEKAYEEFHRALAAKARPSGQ